ncbi:MAG TPA: hypothetical protein VGH82_04885 [Gaiellaceae bacterium]|jgi:hypothetical protein
MNQPVHRYLVGLIAFLATVTLITHGVTTTLIALVVCGAVVYGDRILAAWEQRPRRPRTGPRPERMRVRPLVAESAGYDLVPDEPSLILTPAEF